jgi:hypothetical protein
LRKARVSLTQQTERLTDAYLAAVLPLEEYQRRRHELEQRQQGIAEQARQLEGSRGRHDELAGMVQSIEAFCQRVQQGLAQATLEQKRQLVELLIDRVVVTNEEVEIRYVIPTSPTSEHLRFCHLRLDYFDGICNVQVRTLYSSQSGIQKRKYSRVSLTAADRERYWPERRMDAHERVNAIPSGADSDTIVISLRNPWESQTDLPLSPGQHSLYPQVAQRDAPFKENGSRSFIVACMGSATPAELFPRQQEASDVTRITCEAAWHSTACLLSVRCATRGTLEYGEIISGGRGAETRLLPERKGRRTRCSQDPRGILGTIAEPT